MWATIEGCIGTGKTTLTKALTQHYSGRLLLEETKNHPFIADFYLDSKGYAFQTEMNFVLIHYHQLQRAQKEGLFKHLVFSDFAFDKDRLFADLTLKNPQEQKLFTLTYDLLKQRIPRPDALIGLTAPTEFLFERIRKRARRFETPLSFDYLDRVNAKYKEFLDGYDQSEKIILNAEELHVAQGGSAIEETLRERVIPLMDPIISRFEAP